MKKLTFVFALAVSAAWSSADDAVHFGRDIYPILQDKCFSCHGPEKQKGKLRLDTKDGLFKEDYIVVANNAEESELFIRVALPADDEDIMPPEDKGDPLTAEQQSLIKKWIDAGGEWSEPVEVAATAPVEDVDFERDILPIFSTLSDKDRSLLARWLQQGAQMPGEAGVVAAAEPKLVEAAETEASKKAAETLRAAGVNVMKVAQNVNWLYANFRLSGGEVNDSSLAPVAALANLTDLDLSQTSITDAGLEHIKGLANLTRLNLNNTSITDEGIKHLAGLSNLQYLNLYGTKVSDAGLKHLAGLKCLQKVFLWQTQVTPDGAKELQASLPAAEINLGIEMPESVAAVEAETEEEVKETANAEKPAAEPSEPQLSIATVLLQLTAVDPAPAAPEAAVEPVAESPALSIADVVLEVAVAEVAIEVLSEPEAVVEVVVAEVEAIVEEVSDVVEIVASIEPEVGFSNESVETVAVEPAAEVIEVIETVEPEVGETIGISEAILLIQ